jgi:hypothetical protein
VVVIIDHVVEGAINAIVDVKGLGLSLTPLSSVYLCRNRGGSADKVTSGLCDESNVALAIWVDSCFEFLDCRSDGCCDLEKTWLAGTIGTDIVTGETTADVDHRHFWHAKSVGCLKEPGSMIEGG